MMGHSPSAAPRRPAWLLPAAAAGAALAAIGAVLVLPGTVRIQSAGPPVAANAQPGGAISIHEPTALSPFAFADADGKALTVADFAGKMVLLNLWATWCVPCREEMPALDRLQATLGGPDFEVVALSIDRGGREAVQSFFADVGIKHLRVYLDVPNASTRALGVVGLPTTLLIDRAGREIGRATGPAEWDDPDVTALIRQAVADPIAPADPIRPEKPLRRDRS